MFTLLIWYIHMGLSHYISNTNVLLFRIYSSFNGIILSKFYYDCIMAL